MQSGSDGGLESPVDVFLPFILPCDDLEKKIHHRDEKQIQKFSTNKIDVIIIKQTYRDKTNRRREWV